MMTLEEAKKIIIEKQKRCYRCGKLFDPIFDFSIFLYNHTAQNHRLISNPISGDLNNIIALCDNCYHIIQNREVYA